MARIGIFSGSFNPVHLGHISFALQAIDSAKLDKVYFLPERRPRTKSVEHFAHRVAMINRALKPHPKLKSLELTDMAFSVDTTLTKLQTLFKDDQLVFLFGSDSVRQLNNWPKVDRLLKSAELVIGIRREHNKAEVVSTINRWPQQPRQLVIIEAWAGQVSSTRVRQALRHHYYADGLLSSVASYSNKNWLYVSFI